MTDVNEITAAATRQPSGTLMLRSDKLTPAELADAVLAGAGLDPDINKAVAARVQSEPGSSADDA